MAEGVKLTQEAFVESVQQQLGLDGYHRMVGMGFQVIPCSCDWPKCQGWKFTVLGGIALPIQERSKR